MRQIRSSGAVVELEVARAISSLNSGAVQGDASSHGNGHPPAAESEKKKRQITGSVTSPPLKKQATTSMTEDRKVDPSVLQFQNQKLCQQLEAQKERVQDLEQKLQGLEKKQAAYDANLITVNRIWGQLIDDLGILSVRAGATLNGSKGFTSSADERPEESSETSGDLFLDRLLLSCPKIELELKAGQNLLERALEARSQQTVNILKCVVGGIEQQRQRNEDLQSCAKQHVSDKEVLRALEDNEAALRQEVQQTRTAIDDLHVRHRSLLSEVTLLRDIRLKQQSEITSLSEQLEDTQSELQSSKKKLATLKQQLEASGSSSCMHGTPRSVSRNDLLNGEQVKAAAEEVERLRSSLQEAQDLAAQRLKEIELKHEEHLEQTKKLRELESALSDEQRTKSSRAYALLGEQLSAAKAETDRLHAVVDGLQKERNGWIMREKDLLSRAEAGDSARRAFLQSETRVKELEEKLGQTLDARDDLQLKLEELRAAAGRGETVEEMRIMLGSAEKEMGLMREQLKKYRELAEEVPAVRAQSVTLQEVLQRKMEECAEVKTRFNAMVELLKQQDEEMKAMKGKERELCLFVDMYARESLDRRDVREVKQAEARALAQVEQLKAELDEHGLALRVKAANEAEAACQQRLAAAEAEVTRLREQLSEREKSVLEMQETLKARAEDTEIYTSEIETISQAYEEMQTQNRRLLQQITERDEYNTQLMAESVKAKQQEALVSAEKEAVESRIRHASAIAAIDRQRVQQLEGKMECLTEQLERILEEGRKARSELEVAKKLQADAERESATLKRAALESEKDLVHREKRAADAEELLEKERHKMRRLEEEKMVLTRKLQKAESVEKGNSSVAVELEELREELKECKSLLKCSVCHDRRKEVAITKCFHLFCSPCIQRNLELRHRKCPGCGVPFGQGDVKTVYL